MWPPNSHPVGYAVWETLQDIVTEDRSFKSKSVQELKGVGLIVTGGTVAWWYSG